MLNAGWKMVLNTLLIFIKPILIISLMIQFSMRNRKKIIMKLKIKMILIRRMELNQMLKVASITGVIGVIIFLERKKKLKDQ